MRSDPLTTVIFGGAGFAGLNIAEALLKRGRPVTVFDRNDVPAAARAAFAKLPGKLEAIRGNVMDPAAVERAIAPGTDGVIFGTAVTANAARDAAEPELVLNTNLMSLVPILRRAKAVGVRRVVNLSSVAALGAAGDRVPVMDETTAPDPQSLYALTKFSTERVAERLGSLWNLDVISVRLCSVFGPWEYATGLRDTLSPHLQVMLAADARQPALLPRPVKRDWTYAPDMADGVVAVLDAKAPKHRLYHVAPGVTWSILDWGNALAKVRPGFVCRVIKDGETPNIDPHAPSDRAPLSADRIAQDLGWRAQTSMAESITAYDAWWQAHWKKFGVTG
jgi:UDP-glucose 4-epimerase